MGSMDPWALGPGDIPYYEGMPRTNYVKSGQWVRRHHPMSKLEHVGVGDAFLNGAGRRMDLYYRDVQDGLKTLASRGVDPGPLISGVISDKFSSTFKDRLRTQLRIINALVDAAMGHYAAAGKRVSTYRAEYHRRVKAS
jgi:hypothetical protein